MIYLDNAATTQRKPQQVLDAVVQAMTTMGNASRGAHGSALEAARAGECGAAALLLALYGVLGGAAVIGVVLALRQRLREIDGGEEDDAAQY